MIFKVKIGFLKFCLKILGLTGILFVMESCYGAPSAYLIKPPVGNEINQAMVLVTDTIADKLK